MFSKATLQLAGGRTLTIARNGDGIYVKNVTLNGKPFTTNWLAMDRVRAGVTRLEFTTQAEPDTTRGTKVADRPPALQ